MALKPIFNFSEARWSFFINLIVEVRIRIGKRLIRLSSVPQCRCKIWISLTYYIILKRLGIVFSVYKKTALTPLIQDKVWVKIIENPWPATIILLFFFIVKLSKWIYFSLPFFSSWPSMDNRFCLSMITILLNPMSIFFFNISTLPIS